MSVENFRSRFPPDSFLKATIEGIQTRENLFGSSLVIILAKQLVKEGRDGIREIVNRLNPGSIMSKMIPEDFQRLSEEARQRIFDSYAAIVFGVCVVALEDTLVTRKYDHKEFFRNYNLAIQGLQLSEVVAKEEVQELPDDRLKNMYSVVGEDKTFALFFEEAGIRATPDPMYAFLEQTLMLPVIRKSILSMFRERAKFLIAPKMQK